MGLMFARRRMEEKKARAKARVEEVAAEVLPPTAAQIPAEEKPPGEPLVLERPKHAAKIEKAKQAQRRAIQRDGE